MPPKNVRNFVFTLNNYDAKLEQHVKDFDCAYMVFGHEVGESGTPHLQGYCELKKQTNFKTLKKDFPTGAHIEPRKGSARQASDYCKKDGKDVYESGSMKSPGTRNDIHDLKKSLDDGMRGVDLWDAHLGTMLKYHKGVAKYISMKNNDNKFRPVRVEVYWGDAGSGKSSTCYKLDPGLYKLPPPSSGGTIWFDGYAGESTLLLDDFYGGIKYSYLLQLLDGYAMHLQIKGGFVYKNWTRVLITSNQHPRHWYGGSIGYPAALRRRISTIYEVTQEGEEAPWDEPEEKTIKNK